MTDRMDPIEKLARRICWLEFSKPRNQFGTEKTYWKRMPKDARLQRVHDARRFLWELEALHETDSSMEILENARDYYDDTRGRR